MKQIHFTGLTTIQIINRYFQNFYNNLEQIKRTVFNLPSMLKNTFKRYLLPVGTSNPRKEVNITADCNRSQALSCDVFEKNLQRAEKEKSRESVGPVDTYRWKLQREHFLPSLLNSFFNSILSPSCKFLICESLFFVINKVLLKYASIYSIYKRCSIIC